MRSIHVYASDGELHELFIPDEAAANSMLESGMLYPCKGHSDDEDFGHDLHLSPDFAWDLAGVEHLLTSIKHS